MSNPEIDQSILNLWATHQTLRQDVRRSQAELKQVRRNLGLLLAEKQKELAVIGSAGAFLAWLRLNRIPASTAYRLIAQVTGAPTQTNVPTGNGKIGVPVCGQSWELFGDVLVIRMTPKCREKFRAAVEIWEEAHPQIDLEYAILTQLTRMIPNQFRGPIVTIDHQPDSDFVRASYPAIGWPNRTPPPLPPGRASSARVPGNVGVAEGRTGT